MQQRYASGTSRGTRSATTLLAQVADLERGQRIKAQREDLHLTQPAVVDLLEDAARELPRDHPLHPEKLGKPPVTLRGYQTWEQGGGIAWEKAKLLAGVLRTDVAGLINGTPTETPDPFAGADDTIEERLAELAEELARDRQDREANIAEVKALLQTQNENLAAQTKILDELKQLLAMQQSAARALDQEVQRTIARLQAAAPLQEQAAETSAPSSSPAASKQGRA